MQVIRVLVADDETMMRELLVARLGAEPDLEVVAAADNGQQAVEQALALRPDVVIMDLQMPVLNGIEATEQILARLPGTRIVMLSSFGELVTLGHISGASECLHKQCKAQELVAAVRRAAQAVPSVPSGPPEPDPVERIDGEVGLSAREKAVLAKVIHTELTLHQIATALSRESGQRVTHSSVKHALDRVMVKLQLEPHTRAALVKRVLDTVRR